MTTFDELGLGEEVTRALEERGFGEATPFQEQAVPVLRRGHNVVARAGPGAGILVGLAASLFDRIEPGGDALQALLVTPTEERAEALARSAARIAAGTSHTVAALGPAWVDPGRADLLLATPEAALSEVRHSRIKLDGLEAFLIEGTASIQEFGAFDSVETLAELVPGSAQRVVLSLPLSSSVGEFAERHLRKAVHIPPRSAVEEDDTHIPHRGELRHHGLQGARTDALLALVPHLLETPGTRLLVFLHSAHEAAKVGETLELHGHRPGSPGERDRRIWLAWEEKKTRSAVAALDRPRSVVTLSYRVPFGPDSLDRRHGSGGDAHVLVRGRDLPHLREAAREAGYTLSAAPTPIPPSQQSALVQFRDRIRRVLEEEDLSADLLLLEPLLRTRGAAEVAAAAVRLLRKRPPAPSGEAAGPEPGTEEDHPPAWVRLFVSLGHRDHVGPGDILGAITGEAAIDGERVGRIDIRDTFSLVEVSPSVAERVIEAVNGITVKGRSVRVDYHRRRGGEGTRGGRSGAPRKS